ncbi:reverse transcriptase domain-containing protein [Tanacetum coccineum]
MAPKRATRSNTTPETTNTTSVTNAQLQAMIDQGVTVALAARDADRNTNDDDSHNSGTGVKRTERTTRECTYTDFLKCQPLNFKDTEGVVGLSQWFERMDSIFHMSNCTVENQVEFATCTLHSFALTWNWLCCVGGCFPKNLIKLKKYFDGLPDMIHGSVVASKPKTIQEAVEITTELMDKKIRTFADRTSEKKLYGGSKPLCPKCNYHHDGPCAPECHKCNRGCHLAHDCRSPANANTANNQRGTGTAHGNYKPTIKDKDGKDVVTPYEKLDENQKKMLSKNDEAKMFLKRTWRLQRTREKYKSLALKARQVLSDDDTSSSDSNDEEYVMAVRDFKKFLRRRGKFVRQPYDDKKNFRKIKEDKKEERRCFKCGDPNHFISDCPKNVSGDQKAFVVGSWSDSGDDSKKEEICLMASPQTSSNEQHRLSDDSAEKGKELEINVVRLDVNLLSIPYGAIFMHS